MINQGPNLERWLAFQRTNPPKVTWNLETPSGRCCLGNACHLLIPHLAEPKDYLGLHTRYSGARTILPPEAITILGIEERGLFTETGRRLVQIFLRENNVVVAEGCVDDEHCFCLTGVNDHTNADHALIGDLIEHLAHVEREQGIECFATP